MISTRSLPGLYNKKALMMSQGFDGFDAGDWYYFIRVIFFVAE